MGIKPQTFRTQPNFLMKFSVGTIRPKIARLGRENSREICQVTLAYRINLAKIDVDSNRRSEPNF